MIQECYICRIRYGEKEPLEDKGVTHGLCERCLKKELEKLEEFKKTKRRIINMPKGKKPKVGDFVLWEDDIWVIEEIKGKKVTAVNHATGDVDELYTRSMEETDIRTWEFQ